MKKKTQPHAVAQNRLYYLDLIRTFLTALVFYHHSAIAFGANGGWYYYAGEKFAGLTDALFDLSVTIDQSYFMGLFFFISAYFVPASFRRKGLKAFLLDRQNRLAVPLLVYTFLLDPLLEYAIWGNMGSPGWGVMWFVLTLLIFEQLYAVVSSLAPRWHLPDWKRPTAPGILAFMAVTGLASFLVRQFVPVGENVIGLQLAYYPLYIGMYLAGLVARRNRWLEGISLRRAMPWFLAVWIVGIPSVIAMQLISPESVNGSYNGGWGLNALFYACWDPLMCVGISGFLMAATKAWFNRPIRWVQSCSSLSFAFYFIHPVVVVGFTALTEMLPCSPVQRLAFVLLAGIPCCLLLAWIVRGLFRLVGVKM